MNIGNIYFLIEKVEKVESKEFTMVKIKWPKNDKMTYTDDIIKIIFGKYGEIKDVMVFPKERKALIEYKYRLSAVRENLKKQYLTFHFRRKHMKIIKQKKRKRKDLMME